MFKMNENERPFRFPRFPFRKAPDCRKPANFLRFFITPFQSLRRFSQPNSKHERFLNGTFSARSMSEVHSPLKLNGEPTSHPPRH